MADDSDKQDAPKLPPKLNLRKQGVLKQGPAAEAKPPAQPEVKPQAEMPSEPTLAPKPAGDTAVKQSTSRLVVKPAASKPKPEVPPAEKAEPAPVLAAAEAAAAASPAVRLKPLQPKPAPAAKAPEPTEAKAEEAPEPPAEKAEAPAKTNTKRKTSRIPLESAKAPEEKAGAKEGAAKLKPKTIKIKPSAPVPKVRSTQPLSITVPIAEEDTEKIRTDAAKRQTSRIPLEDALTADKESDEPAEPVDPARPKTIKIKRPGSEAATVKAKKPVPKKGDDGEMGKTARLDHLPLDEAETTPTQKKTIRVKRPDGASTTAPVAAAPAAPRPGLGLTPPEPIEQPRSDEPGGVWAILALAATLVLCVVIYMLAAQAFGPNVSGTALSSWTGGPNLSWPGKIVN
ncbi:MAG: hypothetical protein ISS31_05980 [Kiritimatiellae bacterium]|nr:hypothetical protein [Kiritimatiellia bacterium]